MGGEDSPSVKGTSCGRAGPPEEEPGCGWTVHQEGQGWESRGGAGVLKALGGEGGCWGQMGGPGRVLDRGSVTQCKSGRRRTVASLGLLLAPGCDLGPVTSPPGPSVSLFENRSMA